MLCNIKPVPFHESDKHIFAKIPGGGVSGPPVPPLWIRPCVIHLTQHKLQIIVFVCLKEVFADSRVLIIQKLQSLMEVCWIKRLSQITNHKRYYTEICTDIPDIPCNNCILHIYSSGCNRSMFLCLPCVILWAQPCFFTQVGT